MAILYKSLRGLPLTAAEKKYDAAESHEINVMKEVMNGIRWASSVQLVKSMWDSITSGVSHGLFNQIPAIAGYYAVRFAGPALIEKAIGATLDQAPLTDEQKKFLTPWLNALGRVVLAKHEHVFIVLKGEEIR